MIKMDNCNQSGAVKSVRGWMHPDQIIADTGMSYGVRYVGCLEVNTSMKSLDFDTRSLVAKECITRLCETAGLKTADKKRKVDKRLLKMIAEKPNMDHAGANVSLTVTSSYLKLVSMDNGDVIAFHEMPKISFASGGDPDTMDFISYVAKDQRYGRACFVIECGPGLSQDVITTIGQAFELRYKQYIKKTPSRTEIEINASSSPLNGNAGPPRDDPEYYNDLPGKMPPDVIANAAFLENTTAKQSELNSTVKETNANMQPFPKPYASSPVNKEFPDSLIDFTSTITNITPSLAMSNSSMSTNNSNKLATSYASVFRRPPPPEYVNTTSVIANERPFDSSRQKSSNHDIFDMQPFVTSLNPLDAPLESLLDSSNFTPCPPPISTAVLSAESQKANLQDEAWFHGPISRHESENLVIKDGDFLVRESQNTPGQYVLTGMQKNMRKHLLLVDPQGVIRTKDHVFESVSHLIQHHRDNCLPIISAESALVLRTPVLRSRITASRPVQV